MVFPNSGASPARKCRTTAARSVRYVPGPMKAPAPPRLLFGQRPAQGCLLRELLVAGTATLALSCGAEGPHEGVQLVGASSVVSQSGALHVSVASAPSPLPVRGKNQIEFDVVLADSGIPADGLGMRMVPFMPAMGHGSPQQPTAIALGDGRYRFHDVILSMPGLWELRTTISGTESDYVAPRFDVR